MLYRAGGTCKLVGDGPFPKAGELTGQIMLAGISSFMRRLWRGHAAAPRGAHRTRPPPVPGSDRCGAAAPRPVSAPAARSVRYLPPPNWWNRTSGRTTLPAISAVTCSRSTRRSISAQRLWVTGWVRRVLRHSTRQTPTAVRSVLWATAGSGITGWRPRSGTRCSTRNDGVIVIVDNYYSARNRGGRTSCPAGPRMRRNPLSTQSAMRWQGWG